MVREVLAETPGVTLAIAERAIAQVQAAGGDGDAMIRAVEAAAAAALASGTPTRASAPAPAAAADDVRQALDQAGIRGRTADELAAMADVTTDRIKRAAAEAHRRGARNPVGLTVTLLRSADDLPPTPDELAEHRQTQHAQAQAARAAERADQAREQQAKDDAELASLNREQLAHLHEQVCAGKTRLDLTDRLRLRDADPLTHAELRHHLAGCFKVYGMGGNGHDPDPPRRRRRAVTTAAD